MNRTFLRGLLLGALAGGALTAAVFLLRKTEIPPEPARDIRRPVAVENPLREENLRLQKQIEELREPAVPKPATPVETPPPGPDLPAAFAALVKKGFAAFGGKEFQEAVEAAKKTKDVAFLVDALRSGKTSQERFMAGALLEAVADPETIPALADALKNDPDDLVRRMVSHAIAVMGTGAAEAPLRAAMTADKDFGVRANAAYGVAKLGKDDGLRLLENAYTSRETLPEYRLAILSGLADVAAPTTAPLFRRILSETRELSYLLMSIGALVKMKDTGSRPELRRLADSDLPSTVREAAQKALTDLGP